MPAYVPIEYPKWVGGVLVQNATEELAQRAPPGASASAEAPAWLSGASGMSKPRYGPHLEKTKRAPHAKAVAPAVAVSPQPAGPTSAAAVRMRRARARRREGKRTIRCDLSGAQIDALAGAGFLDPAKQDDAAELAWGVGRLMDGLTRSVPVATHSGRVQRAQPARAPSPLFRDDGGLQSPCRRS
jgi:hypothetical protein